jgi:type IV secretory pathway TrbL component
VYSHRHFLGAALHVEVPQNHAPASGPGVAQQLAALAEGHLHQLLQHSHVQCRRQWVRHHAHHGAVHARGGSKLSGGTNSTFSMA